jgi:hypothetical protein
VNKITPRVRTYIFAGLALLALILLSISVNSLEMAPGLPFSFPQIMPKVVDPSISLGSMRFLLAVLRVIMIVAWIGLPFYIILLFISKDERKRFIRMMAFLVPILIMLYFLANNQSTKKAADNIDPRIFGNTGADTGLATPVTLPEFKPPPQWVTTLTTVVIALAITAIVLGISFMLWKRSRDQMRLKEPLRKVERQAQAALDAIISGGNLRDAIMRCYLQMLQTLQEYRGIQRDRDMTPHEFESYLINRGIPGEPLHQLTRLFEEVRYGTLTPGRRDEQVAVSSLSAIVSACQRAVEKRG